MHLHTEVHFVWNMAEGIEPPTFSSTILRIDFRPKRSKRALGTEVSRCTWNETSVLNVENKSSRRKLVTAADSLHQLQTFELSGKTGSSFYTCKHCYSENGLRALAYAVRLINST